jgi:hypothetical protein
VLAKLITVDGPGSGLDADLLDGQSGTYYLARANHTGTQAESTITNLVTDLAAKIGEAPTDGQQYARQSSTWSVVSGGGGGGIPEAPSDSKVYARRNSAWVDVGTYYVPLTGNVLLGTGNAYLAVGNWGFYMQASDPEGGMYAFGDPPHGTFMQGNANGVYSIAMGVDLTNWTDLPQYVFAKTGLTTTVPIILPSDPATALQAATKQYVDAVQTNVNLKAPLASPVFTGDPQAPTPATADNDTSVATTAYVKANLASYAALASPTFTGDPKAPTPATADNDTSIATTAFVKAQGYGTGTVTGVTGTAPVISSGGNTPAISMPAATTSVSGYLTSADWNTFNGKAPLASPAFTGNPTAPTPTAGDNDTSLATTAFVTTAVASKLADAPSDGKMYFRQNGAWVALVSIDQIGA